MTGFGRILAIALFATLPAVCQQNPEAVRFFEMKIRPLLHDNCAGCHNDQKPTSGLSLESSTGVRNGGNRGPVAIAGKPEESRLIQAVEYDGALKMPPPGKLKDEQIADLKRWVELGMPWPDEKESHATARRKGLNHWAFKPVTPYEPPHVRDASWVRNPIDNFILARLEKEGLEHSREADRATLIRRLSLDLLGLPPTPAEVDRFLADRSPNAYERLVDRLLASPHYGERWGRHWLDAARYADTNGFGFDNPRVMWRYRDWVIQSLNRDMPFDEFTIEQLAGDLLPNATVENRIATGFQRNTMINQEGGVDQEQYRVEAVFDRVATTGTVWLGLTIGCAQCHDHKYDPVSQREYYQIFAFYNNQEEPAMRVVPQGEVERYRRISGDFELEKVKIEEQIARRNAGLVDRMIAWEKDLTAEQKSKLPGNVRDILKTPPEKRELAQEEDLEKFYNESDAAYQDLLHRKEVLVATPNSRNPDQYTAMVLAEREQPRKSWVLIRGDFLKHGVEVTPATLAVLPPMESPHTYPNRLDLAKWLVNPRNPLTPRVVVNRMWQHYFGRGLVKTSEDFGTQGEPPSHPELLDWLATEFVRQGWHWKAMHRLVVTSATYRQASQETPEVKERDPEDVLLERAPRYRVDAEIVRDIVLATSGLLNPQIGGPSVFPPQPPGITDLSRGNLAWIVATGQDRYRRGMYTFWKRTSPYPSLLVFDEPTADATTVRRTRSNSPMQALTLLNDEAYVEMTKALAARVLREAPTNDPERLRYAFRLCLTREPDGAEKDSLATTLDTFLQHYRQKPEEARALLPTDVREDPVRFAAWFGVARVLLNLDETITRE
jgi:hypothetical protein